MDTLSETPVEAVISDEPATIDDIVEERRAAREAAGKTPDDDTVDEAEETQEIEGDPSAQDAEEPDEVNLSEADEEEEADGDTEAAEPIPAPHFWNAEGKKHFASLDPVTQAYVLEQDKNAQAAFTRSQADLQNQLQAKTDELTRESQAKLTQLDNTIATLEQSFNGKYASDVELAQLVRAGEINASQAYEHQLERAAAQAQIEEAKQTQLTQTQQVMQQAQYRRSQELTAKQPEILQPETTKQVVKYILDNGFTQEDLDYTSASGLIMAYESMLYRQGKAKLKNKPKSPPKPPARATKPSGQSASKPNAEISALEKRAAQTGDLEDILALRRAKRNSKAA